MRKLLALLVVAGTVVVPLHAAAATVPTPPAASTSTTTRNAAGWLAAQVTPGGFIESGTTPGTADLPNTAQAILALEAARFARLKVDAMLDYLAAHVDAYVVGGGADQPGALSYLILDAVGAGRDPHSFGGSDLVTRLQATEQPSGLFGAQDATYDGAFRQGLSMAALHAAGASADAAAIGWLTGQQCPDGSWTSLRTDTSAPCPAVDTDTFTGPDTNSTALAAVGLHDQGATPAHNPVTWLNSVRSASGGFPYLGQSTLEADANSTGVVVQALLTLNGTPDTAGLTALAGFQAGCAADPADRGGIAYQPGPGDSLVPNLLATLQALPALAGQPLPLDGSSVSIEVPTACTPPPTANQAFVSVAYFDFMHRLPMAAELSITVAALTSGAEARSAFITGLAHSDEQATAIVSQLYRTTLGRDGDAAGVTYWADQLRSGARSVANVAANFYAGAEYYSHLGGGTPQTWITDLYAKLLHRGVDAGGLTYWEAQAASAGRVSVALRLFQSPESAHDRVAALYQSLLGRTPDAAGADYWATRVVSDGDLSLAANLASSAEYATRARIRFP